MSIKPESFEKRLSTYFERYTTTIYILKSLLTQQVAPQDFIVLACARLDSLANHAVPGKTSQSERFSRFLFEHSGHAGVLEQVSAGNLYSSILAEWWQLAGVVEIPGRLRVFDEVKQRDFIELYWKSGLPLTEDELGYLLDFLQKQIRAGFRVIPNQSRKKAYVGRIAGMHSYLKDGSAQLSGGRYVPAVSAVKPILKSHQLATILYTEYRNGSIHGGGVDLEEEVFFKAAMPYWSPVEYVFAGIKPIFQVSFPAKFLLSIYENCVTGYQKKLLATKKLPPSIFYEMFPGPLMRHLEYLDNKSVEEGNELRPR